MTNVEAFGPPKGLPKVRYTDYYEGVDRAPCTITLPRDLLEEFRRFGVRVGVTHNALVALALDQYLRRHTAKTQAGEEEHEWPRRQKQGLYGYR